ncbi:ABC transporter permease [Phycicoccus duodecadis]|uniref:ABC-type nitrate/sulfonate/bicarbonate transport system permease component n=1 Tax=Phycicoccus duodecadis TaxID=173053 RepID=A0A2N3YF56_9MICO|nr:ABC transporter permease [Phycicoccus duodecadis]PKW25494.1 ABC-type nitrate/sulfonate/bicarbonate transport system permease component [Phycicoccus duodecadis]
MSTASIGPSRSRRLPLPGSDALLGVLGLVTVGVVGEVLPRSGLVNPHYLPPTSQILARLAQIVVDPDFWTLLGLTVRGWALGLALAMVLGVGLGLVIGSVPFLRDATSSTIEFLRPIPSVALIPLVVLLFGSRLPSALVLVVYAATWQVLVQVLYGVADVDPVARDTARSYRFSVFSTGRHVVWPTALPYVVTGFRLAAAVALILEITAELVIGVPGLGQTIGVAQSSGAVPETYALVIAVGLLGVAVNLLARAIEKRVLRWHPSVRRDAA